MKRLSIALCAAALACTPSLSGVCTSTADCKSGESCSTDGICLRSETGDAGNSDAGTDGGSTNGSVSIFAPSSGAFEKGIFNISANAVSSAAIQDVTFYLTKTSNGAALGQIAGAQSGSTWSGSLIVGDPAFGGNADLKAIMHRASGDVTSSTVLVVIDQNAPTIAPAWDAGVWWALNSVITVTAAVADDRSGVASAELDLPDGGSFAASVSGSVATFSLPANTVGSAGATVSQSVSLAATDHAGNRGGGASVTSTIRVDAQPPSISVVGLDPAVWRNGPLDVNATVSDGTGSGVASTSLLLSGAFTAGTPDGGGGYNYHADLSGLPATQAAIGLQLIAVDNVSNQSDAGFTINVDNVPPVIASPSIDTAFDGTDSSSQGWFAGPTAAPSATAPPIVVSAAVSDPNLVTTGANAPAAIVGGNRYAGTLSLGRWTFSIPRIVGQSASGPITVSFDAQDLAGNHAATPPALSLQFDDVPASGFVPAIAADNAWYPRAPAIKPTVSVTFSGLPRSGLASVVLQVASQPDVACSGSASSWSCAMPSTYAPPGQQGALAFTVVATAVSGVSSSSSGSRKIDDQPPSITPVVLDPSIWRNGPLDVNAGINDGTGSGVASASLLLNGGFTGGAPDGGGGYNFHTNLSALPATQTAVGLQIIAVDKATNQADAGFSINVDNVPPTIGSASIDTPFDGTDGSNQGWFKGPTAAPAAGAIAVSAVISDPNLITTGGSAPAAVVGANRYPGTLSLGRWNFSIPRSVGQNASAAVTVTFDAQDAAGNHATAPPSFSLQFDDVPAALYGLAIASDPAWYARSGSVPVAVTFGQAPRSGFASVLLKATGKTDVACTSSSALNWSCSLPATYATAATEGPFNFSVAATSVTSISSTSPGSRSIDDAPPVISNSGAIPYPPAATGTPLAWSHDGSHFTLRDSGTIYTFTAYDCGSGLNLTPASFGFSPQLGTRNISVSDSGNVAGCGAHIYNVAVTGDLSTSTPGSFANADNTLTVSATLQDNVANQAQSTKGVNATRRLWQTGNISASALALGPAVVVTASASGSIALVNTPDGSAGWTIPNTNGLFSGPAVGGTPGNETVYYGIVDPSPSATGLDFFSTPVSSASPFGCNLKVSLGKPSGCLNSPSGKLRNALFLALATDGSAVVIEDDTSWATASGGAPCGQGGYGAWRMNGGCSGNPNLVPSTNTQSSLTAVPGQSVFGLAVGRAGQVFYSVLGLPREVLIGGGTVATGTVACGTLNSGIASVSDNAGADAPICSGQRISFNGSAFGSSPIWSAGLLPPVLDAAGVVLARNGSGQTLAVALSSGTALAGAGALAWAIDASPTPVVYLSSGSTLSTQTLLPTGFTGTAAWGLPAVPGSVVTDMVMDKTGILYVASAGQVSAIITDSPGLGTANAAWPIAGHDACRSANLEYACPY